MEPGIAVSIPKNLCCLVSSGGILIVLIGMLTLVIIPVSGVMVITWLVCLVCIVRKGGDYHGC